MPPFNVVLQTCGQSMAGRFVRHFRDRGPNLLTFPQQLAQHATELGPRTDHTGPCLVLLEGLTVQPTEFLQWLLPTVHVRRMVLRLYWIDASLPVHDSWDDLMADIIARGPPDDGVVRITCYPKKLEAKLGAALPLTWALDLQVFTHVLAVVHADGTWRWSLTPASWLYRQGLSEGYLQLNELAGQAVCKLDEALHTLGIVTSVLPRLGNVVDLGAAPGSWTSYLAKHARMVLSVDPAELHPEVLALPNVRHLRMRSEAAVPIIRDLLHGDEVDLLVSDMNMHPEEASNVLATMLPCLRAGAYVILTLKFAGSTRDRSKSAAIIFAKYEGLLEDHRLVWLLSNTNCEITYVGRRSSKQGALTAPHNGHVTPCTAEL